MGSLNDFWNTSNRANNFLETGIVNDTVRNEVNDDGSSRKHASDTTAAAMYEHLSVRGWICLRKW